MFKPSTHIPWIMITNPDLLGNILEESLVFKMLTNMVKIYNDFFSDKKELWKLYMTSMATIK